MTIAKHSTHTFDSETYRALERHAVKRGFFDTEIVKQAANQAQETELSLEATGDLLQDLCKLADGLRAKGFDKQADTLEHNILLYKSAAGQLYDVTGETGENLLDFAHPEGDVILVGEGELAKVETQQSTAKKVRDIAEKNPTGKAGSKSWAAIIREAQVGTQEKFWGVTQETPSSPGEAAVKATVQREIDHIFNKVAAAKKPNFQVSVVPDDSIKNAVRTNAQVKEIYSWAAKIPPYYIDRYFDVVSTLGNTEIPSLAYLTEWAKGKILNNNGGEVNAVANKIGANTFAAVANDDYETAAKAIASQWNLFKRQVWNYTQVQNTVAAVEQALARKLDAIDASSVGIVGEQGEVDVNAGLRKLADIKRRVVEADNSQEATTLGTIISVLKPALIGSFKQYWTQLYAAIQNASTDLAQRGGGGGLVSGTLGPVDKAITFWRKINQDDINEGSSEADVSAENVQQLERLRSLLARYDGGTWAALKKALPEFTKLDSRFNVNSFVDFKAALNQMMAEANVK